ncbi:hypothetical protein [Lignipirellula cremea]|uniref:Uncharacterized protein n=1 Tax=Lignipirellula cremea TaxID=2528010 RepID=A0A518E3T0_9BACT|nr:hypothetical protein [Lignipirellula cremea]QDU98755.1 hypothetical protein Pla8534_66280 [Lignipirellula cremea]
MSNASAELPALSQTVAQGLLALRRRMVLWVLLDGLAQVGLTALIWATVDFLLDYYFYLDVSQRAIMLALGGVAIAWRAWRRWVRPLLKMPTDDALCLQVERRYPHLADRLISALQFSRLSAAEQSRMSPQLMQAAVAQGAAAAQETRFPAALRQQKQTLNLALIAGCLVAGLGGAALLGAERTRVWADRNLLLSDQMWPQSTRFLIHGLQPDGRVAVPRGDAWRQVVEIAEDSPETPDEVYLDFRPVAGRPAVKLNRLERDERLFSTEFPSVHEAFRFRARSGRSISPWVEVVLVEQPAVRELDLTVDPPAYTGGERITLPRDAGPHAVLLGSTVSLKGRANKPLASGRLLLLHPRRAETWGEVPLQLDDDRLGFSVVLSPDQWPGQRPETADTAPSTAAYQAAQSVRVRIELEDTVGLKSRRPTTFGLRVLLDREPRVRLDLSGVGGMVTPNARLPLAAEIEDDFLITSAMLNLAWRGDDPQNNGKAEVGFEQLDQQLPAAQASMQDALELEELAITPPASLTLQLAAQDNDDVSGPHVGLSNERLVRVVTEEELRADLLRREKEQRQEFKRLYEEQLELSVEARALAADTRDAAALSNIQIETLMTLQKKQKLTATNTELISTRLAGHLLEIANNRLEEPDGPLQRRLLENIIKPMARLATEQIPRTVGRFDQARRHAAAAEPRRESLDQAIAGQDQTAAAMAEILSYMARVEGYQEAVNLLYELEKSQQGVFDLTVEEREARIKRLLEGEPEENKTPEKPGNSPPPASDE